MSTSSTNSNESSKTKSPPTAVATVGTTEAHGLVNIIDILCIDTNSGVSSTSTIVEPVPDSEDGFLVTEDAEFSLRLVIKNDELDEPIIKVSKIDKKNGEKDSSANGEEEKDNDEEKTDK